MNIEVELKVYADDLDAVKVRLEEAGARFVKEQKESDTYFSHPARDFGTTDEALRIRTIEVLYNGDRGAVSELSYKGPKFESTSKTREEYTIPLDDRNTAETILQKLGFIKGMDIIKRRSIFMLSGITICLDDVSELGSFVEAERIINREDELDLILNEMRDLLKDTLELDRFERRSYLELLLNKRQER